MVVSIVYKFRSIIFSYQIKLAEIIIFVSNVVNTKFSVAYLQLHYWQIYVSSWYLIYDKSAIYREMILTSLRVSTADKGNIEHVPVDKSNSGHSTMYICLRFGLSTVTHVFHFHSFFGKCSKLCNDESYGVQVKFKFPACVFWFRYC